MSANATPHQPHSRASDGSGNQTHQKTSRLPCSHGGGGVYDHIAIMASTFTDSLCRDLLSLSLFSHSSLIDRRCCQLRVELCGVLKESKQLMRQYTGCVQTQHEENIRLTHCRLFLISCHTQQIHANVHLYIDFVFDGCCWLTQRAFWDIWFPTSCFLQSISTKSEKMGFN